MGDSRLLILLFAAAALACATPGRARREGCHEVGNSERPEVSALSLELETTEGPMSLRVSYYGNQCPTSMGSLSVGLVDATSRHVVIEPRFRTIIPLTPRASLVERSGYTSITRNLYVHGQGLDDSRALEVRGEGLQQEDAPMGAAAAGLPTPRAITLITSGGRFEFRNAWAEITGDRVLIHAVSEGGVPVSQLWSLEGVPLTPVLGRMEWIDRRLVTRTIQLDHPDYAGQHVYLPLQHDGKPAPIPERSIGLLIIDDPVYTSKFDVTPRVLRVVALWLEGEEVLFKSVTPDWGSYVKRGSPFKGLKPAPVCDTGSANYCSTHLAKRYGWTFVDRRQEPVHFPWLGVSGSFDNPEAAITLVRERQKTPFEELARRRREALFAGIRAGRSSPCQGGIVSFADMPNDVLEQYFRNCSTNPADWTRHGGRVSAEALQLARQRHTEAIERRKREQEEIFEAQAQKAREEAAWRAGLEAAINRVQSGAAATMQHQYDTYRRNLRAYNSGAQNWCCGGVKPK